MSLEDEHKRNLELLKGLKLPRKVRNKMPPPVDEDLVEAILSEGNDKEPSRFSEELDRHRQVPPNDRLHRSEDELECTGANDGTCPKHPKSRLAGSAGATKHFDYPLTNSGPLCHAEESGYLDSEEVFCPFSDSPDYACTAGCTSNRNRTCIVGEE